MIFDYNHAFARNIGWVTANEQSVLRQKRIAIAGLGGVGGVHLLTLARLGISRFSIADGDSFDLINFNRQAGATVSTINRPKIEILADMVHDINPEAELRLFEKGIDENNLDDFLQDVDLYIDGLDFFVLDMRRRTFARCRRMNVPALTAAPIGMGVALLNFLPGTMSFDDYFQFGGNDMTDEEQSIRFMVGLAPAFLQRRYVADPSAVDFATRRTPSTIMGCTLCAGFAATEALKILLNRGQVRAAPHGYQFDAYRNRFVHTWRPGGNRNPLQKLTIWFARRQLAGMRQKQS